MDRSSGLALVAVLSAAVAGATAFAVGGRRVGADEGDRASLLRRVEALERTVEAPPSPGARDDGALRRRIEAIEARLAADEGTRREAAVPGAGPGAAVRGDPASVPEDPRLHETIVVGLAAATGSGDHRAAVARLADHLVRSAGPPLAESEFPWAVRLMDLEARRRRITAKEAEALEPVLSGLPAGHVARPALAEAVAVGWGRDERLGGLLSKFGANAEPAVHQGVLSVLDDEHPGPAFSEYVIRILREERDPAVLAVAMNLDIVEAAATAATAPILVETIAARVLDGTLDADTRRNAGLAIAVASLRDPVAGVAALRRLAENEADPDIADRYRGAAAELLQGSATLKSLERLFE